MWDKERKSEFRPKLTPLGNPDRQLKIPTYREMGHNSSPRMEMMMNPPTQGTFVQQNRLVPNSEFTDAFKPTGEDSPTSPASPRRLF